MAGPLASKEARTAVLVRLDQRTFIHRDALESATSWDYPTYQASLNFSQPVGNRS